jgi:HEAT repeat protein
MRQGQGWTFTDSGYPTAPGIRLSGQPTIGEPLDAVVANLGGVLCKAPNRNEKVEALAALRSIAARKSVEAALLGDVSDPEPAIRLDVIGALLSIGNITHLGEAASALLASDGKLPDYVLHNLRVGIYTGVHQAEALPVLTDLLRSPNVVTRRAAVLAIVHTDGQAAIEPLRSGLDDPDQIVRFNCVLGLAKATGQQDWIPNMDMFKADEAKYLSHWKNEIR